FTVGPLRKLKEESSEFVLKEIVSMDGPFADSTLMPFLPGMSDAGQCSEWEAGIPIDLDKIRDKDEDYWDVFKGTPKAFISIAKAQSIWSNRFGNYTSVRFDQDQFGEKDFLERFKTLNPADLGFFITDVKARGQYAAQNGVDFSQLFFGLSFFLLVAAILLSALLFLFSLENRISQAGTLATLGFKSKQIKNIYLAEGIMVSFAGSLAGILLGVFYTKVVFIFLNGLWNDIIRTNTLEIKVLPFTLLLGFLISMFISFGVILYSVKKKLKQQVVDIQKRTYKASKSWILSFKLIIASVLVIITIAIMIGQFALNESQNPGYFFLSGTLMLIALLIFADYFIKSVKPVNISGFTFSSISIKNIRRNRSRSLSIIILFAIGTFMVISTGSNRSDVVSGTSDISSGSGGFQFYAETTIPVLSDLNNPEIRNKEGLSMNYNIIQFRKMEGDDASCLNLNRISNPAILGVEPEMLNKRFSFVSKTEGLEPENPWMALENDSKSGVIPAIADQTVIQWGLGKKVGDTLYYRNELGDTISLVLVGGLAPSIFQGYIIISNGQFLKNYPSDSGSEVFLIDTPEDMKKMVADELNLAFRDYGWEQQETGSRLAEFYSITNTYLAIFLALGALALILGTFGLAILLARTIIERKSEIALLSAIGYKQSSIFYLLFKEYIVLLTCGILIGFITAILATLPSLLSANTDVSFKTILLITGFILINGMLWISLLTWLSLKGKKPAQAIKSE
ncbi:MAG: FtsX-like permease family protein, partial [Bacteroidales bacterium]|nr:FtsX-like permease family protein [Bacteroidales bacterium]